jgi:ribonuclease P protein component
MGLFYRNTGLTYNRVLVTTRRGYGTAVARNRARRLGREGYRALKPDLKRGYDLAFVFYPGPFKSGERFRQMSDLAGMAGLINVLGSPIRSIHG